MKIAICDDNPDYVRECETLIKKISLKKHINVEIFRYGTGMQLLFAQEENRTKADLVFLDISMPGMSGVNTAHELRKLQSRAEIVFFTHSKENMLDAFDVQALHYIVKEQTSAEKVEEIFTRAAMRIARKTQETIAFNCAGETRSVPVSQIFYFESFRNIITVYYETERFEFYSTMGKLEELLFNRGFIRIHRSYLIALHYIASVAGTEVEMVNGDKLPVSRGRLADLRAALSATQAQEQGR